MEDLKFDCEECDRTFTSKMGLLGHKSSHRRSEKPHEVQVEQPSISVAPLMECLTLKIKRLENLQGLPDPAFAHDTDAAFDLCAAIDLPRICIGAQEKALLPTGIALEIPPGYFGLVCPRSGLAAKNGITVLNGPGVIDETYRKELGVILLNTSNTKFWVNRGDRVGQFILMKKTEIRLEVVEEITLTDRGGFGSTGV